MAKAFAERGMSLALADIDQAKLELAREELESLGAQVRIYPLDVADRDAVCEAVNDAKIFFGAINIVCANAGVAGNMGPLENARVSDWDWVIDVNMKGVAYVVQACLPHLLENPDNAHVVITSSISGLRVYEPSRGQGMYNMCKYGLIGLAEALKVDMQPNSVGVSVLCPSVVNTNLSHSGLNRPEKYGGALSANNDHELANAAASGTDPLQFGRWVVKAIEQNLFYVITHPVDRELVEKRHAKIIEAFENSSQLTSQE